MAGGVKEAGLEALAGAPRLEGPVAVDVVFAFDRLKSAPKSRPCWPITRSSGDGDKLQRALWPAGRSSTMVPRAARAARRRPRC